jgi:hypothetical protein
MGSVSSLTSTLLQSISSSALQSSGLTKSPANATSQADSSQLSPLAKLLSELQQLQQSDPAKYQAVTKQIAANLQTAAQTDTANGDTAGASQLNQLATDFTNASKTGQLPDIQNLAKAVGGGASPGAAHGHHHRAAADPDGDSGSSGSSADKSSPPLSQLLSAYQTNSTQGTSNDPLSIIVKSLSDAGITTA